MALSPRENNFVIIGLVSVLLFLGLQYVVYPIADEHTDTKTQIEMKGSMLQQYQDRLETLPRLEKGLEKLVALLEEKETSLIKAKTPALGAAQVQLIIDTLSKKHSNIKIKSTRVLDSQEYSNYTKIAVRVALTAQTITLTDFLYEIEHQPAHLFVSELNVRIPNPKKPRSLRADIVIEGTMKPSGKHQENPQIHESNTPKSARA